MLEPLLPLLLLLLLLLATGAAVLLPQPIDDLSGEQAKVQRRFFNE
jgi:hypothetical protein